MTNAPIFMKGINGEGSMRAAAPRVLTQAEDTDTPISERANLIRSYGFSSVGEPLKLMAICCTKSTEKPTQMVMQMASIVPNFHPSKTM